MPAPLSKAAGLSNRAGPGRGPGDVEAAGLAATSRPSREGGETEGGAG